MSNLSNGLRAKFLQVNPWPCQGLQQGLLCDSAVSTASTASQKPSFSKAFASQEFDGIYDELDQMLGSFNGNRKLGTIWDFLLTGSQWVGCHTCGFLASCSPLAMWGLLDFNIALRAFSSPLLSSPLFSSLLLLTSSSPRQLLIAVGTAGSQLPALASSRS